MLAIYLSLNGNCLSLLFCYLINVIYDFTLLLFSQKFKKGMEEKILK